MTGVAFVIDPLDALDPVTDTSLGLMEAAADRGLEVWTTEAGRLEAVGGRARALAARQGEQQHIWLDEMAAIFFRTEPPLDQTYVTATSILDLVDPAGTALVNDPRGLRLCSEHLLPLHFPDLAPPTLVTADRSAIRAFVDAQGVAVVKPVDGFAGRGVLRLAEGDPNLPSLIDLSTSHGATVVIVQEFLPEVAEGNKRIFVLDGLPVAAVHRYPADGDFRIGNPAAAAPLTARDREICARLAPTLNRHGLRMAGLDVIGSHLIEVNVTSPGALRKADSLLGWTLCADLLDRILPAADLRRSA